MGDNQTLSNLSNVLLAAHATSIAAACTTFNSSHVHGDCAASAWVVIEDSPTGVAAGIAAGMTVYGSALVPATHLLAAGARRVFTNMAELPSLIDAGRTDNTF